MNVNFTYKQFFFFSALAFIVTFGCIIQAQLFLNWDVGWLLHATSRFLNGGTYTYDFYNLNPPLILFWYLPPLLFARLTGANIILIFPVYIFIVSAVSWYICYVFSRKIFSKHTSSQYVFLAVLAFGFLIVPLYEFGQRDHLFLICLMPYLFAVIYRLEGHKLRLLYAIGIGIFAGLGLSLKPQFLIAPLFVEMYYAWSKRAWFSCVRGETIAISAVFLAHLMLIYFYFPDYLFYVIPNLKPTYYSIISTTWTALILYPFTLICYLLFPVMLITYKNNSYKNFSIIIFLAMMGCLLNYFAQRTNFYYHMVPAIVLALALYSFIFTQLIVQYKKQNISLLLNDAGLLMVVFILYHFFSSFWIIWVYNPVVSEPLSATIVIVTPLMLIVLLALIAVKMPSIRGIRIYTLVLGVAIFIFPALLMYKVFAQQKNYKHYVLNRLITFMHTQPAHSSVYFLSEKGSYGAPLIHYVDADLVQRFDSAWLTKHIAQEVVVNGDQKVREAIRTNDHPAFLINMIVDDFERHKPDLVFVDERNENISFNGKYSHLDYLSYYLENKQFKNEWKNYTYLTTIESPFPFRLKVYKRN